MSEAVRSEPVGLIPWAAWTRSPWLEPAGPVRLPVPPARARPDRTRTGVALVVALGCLAWLLTGGDVPGPGRAAAAASPAPAAACSPAWVTAWQASVQPVPADPALTGATLRMVVHPEASGSLVRVRLSNRFGATPLVVGSTTAAASDGGAGVVPGTARPVAFGGRAEVVVPPGAQVTSDPVPLAAETGTPLAVSIALRAVPATVTGHPVALQTSYLAPSPDPTVTAPAGVFTRPMGSWLVLTGVDVLAARPEAALVAVGDSITDGVGSPIDAGERWSDALAGRLASRGGAARMAVLNAGLSGNRLVADDPVADPDSPLARFDTDVAGSAGATDVVLNIGTNDVAAGRTAARIIPGLQEFARRAEGSGRRVFLTTITPSTAGAHGTPAAVAERDAVNDWVRAHGREYADGVFDFAAAVADPADARRLAPAYDSGDGLHLSAAGYRAIADAVDVAQLSGSPCLADRTPAGIAVAGR